jgi:hypothetical protein
MLPVRIARLRGGRPHNSLCSVRLLGCHFTHTHRAAWQNILVQLISKQMSTDGSINDHLWTTVVKNVPNFIESLAAKCHEICLVGYPASIYSSVRSFLHLFRSITTGPQPPPTRVLHRVRSSASSFSVQSLLFYLTFWHLSFTFKF